MPPYEYLYTLIFYYNWPPLVLWLLIHGGDPAPDLLGRIRFVNNVYYGTLAVVAVVAMASYQEELRSLEDGALAILPAMQIGLGLYYNNVAAPAARNVIKARS
jgi:hypothetical protein